MMEVSQNVELNDVSKEGALLRTLSTELANDVDSLSAPAIASGDEGDAIDERDVNALSAQEVTKSITDPEKKRNAGSDLDALLDKITSIVGCSPRNLDELDSLDKSGDCNSDKSAVDANEKLLDGGNPEKEEETEEIDENEKEVAIAEPVETQNNVEPDSMLQTKESPSNSDESQSENISNENAQVEKEEIDEKLNADVKPVLQNENAEPKSLAKLNNSTDDIFEDALESISSSDEKEPELKVVEKAANVTEDLQEISSDDDDDLLKDAIEPNKLSTDIIELDTSEECEITSVNTTDVADDVTDTVETDLVKDTVDDITSTREESANIDGLEEQEAEFVDESGLKSTEGEEKEDQKKEDQNEEDQKKEDQKEKDQKEDQKEKKDQNQEITQEEKAAPEDPKDQEDAMWVDGEEPKIAEESKKGESQLRTQSEEMNDINIDNLLMDANSQTSEKEDNKNEQPKANGVLETPSNIEGSKLDKEVEANEEEPTKSKAKDAESDDEVIFFESIEKGKTAGTETKTSVQSEEKKVDEPKEPVLADTNKDDEVVLVSEDEDEEIPAKISDNVAPKNLYEEGASTEASSKVPAESMPDKNVLVDDSDNARDQFEKLRTPEKAKSTVPEEGHSNSSSNLLRPGGEDAEAPSSKRVRLSTDNKMEIDDAEAQKAADIEEPSTSKTKRSHVHLDTEVNGEAKQKADEAPFNKKLKTDDSDSNSSCDGALQIDLDAQGDKDQSKSEETTKVLKEEEEEKKEEKPVVLIPPPEIKTEVLPIRLDFVKNFRKNFDSMTRNDLEELVLQKVVEAMLIKSDFAEMRSRLQKCETLLGVYRRKVHDIGKQLHDLDNVHKRVLKDMESKNAQFTAPVRITRAVGLQVGFPLKVISSSTSAAGAILPPPSGTVNKTSNSPPKSSTSQMRSPVRPRPSAPASSTVTSTQTQPQPQPQPQPQQRSSASFTPPPAVGPSTSAANPKRRGCMQKVTPQRPVPSNIVPQAQVNNQANDHRLQSPQSPGPQRILHASKSTTSIAVAVAGKTMAIRNRNSQSGYLPKKARPISGPVPGPSPSKALPKCTTKVRSQVPPGGTVSVPMSSTSAGPGGYGPQQQPSLVPAKPKEKTFIDLTDEDDAAAAAAAVNQQTIEANARLRQVSNMAVKRNALAAAAAAAAAVAAGEGSGPSPAGARGGAHLMRASSMQMSRVNSRQIVQNNGGAQRNSMGSNVTMQIRSENTPPTATPLDCTHPAPLPSSPAQPFNPAWKMPPARPMIRIAMADTGIVISWTLEETATRCADSVTYQIYAYQVTIHEPSTDSWRHVGDVKAMLLPMAVTLNQFQENQRYFFAVRGVDQHHRFGQFSLPTTWH
ncbi:hypothetical protein KR018_002928 [Drosophila ironensis]|nr:hypothetical protein KR018_002928 [Drosophila ironensis]